MTIDFPLVWPVGRARTTSRIRGNFKEARTAITPTRAADRLDHELGLAGAFEPRLTCDGWERFKRGTDVGAAVYFTLVKIPTVIACDRFDRLADNIAGIAAHVEALRGQERWGCSTRAEAFAGHKVLPPSSTIPRAWWDVLGLKPDATIDDIERAHRDGLRRMHPDAGGSHDGMAAINAARDQARKERGA